MGARPANCAPSTPLPGLLEPRRGLRVASRALRTLRTRWSLFVQLSLPRWTGPLPMCPVDGTRPWDPGTWQAVRAERSGSRSRPLRAQLSGPLWASCAGPGAGGVARQQPLGAVVWRRPCLRGVRNVEVSLWLLAHLGSLPALDVPASSPTPFNALLPARRASPPSGLWSRVYPSH